MKTLLAVCLLFVTSSVYGQCLTCQTTQFVSGVVPQTITVEETYIESRPVVTYEQVQKTRQVVYQRMEPVVETRMVIGRQVFDVECGLRIAEDFMACSENATTRRQRFRCAFSAALNNIDCIVGGFSTTAGGVRQRRVLFPRLAARRTARQMVRSY